MKKIPKKSKKIQGAAAGIVLEDIDSKLDLIVENNQAIERRLSEQMSELKSDLKQDIEGIGMVLKLLGEKLNKHDQKITVLEQQLIH